MRVYSVQRLIATVWIQLPVTETACPAMYRRKFRWRSWRYSGQNAVPMSVACHFTSIDTGIADWRRQVAGAATRRLGERMRGLSDGRHAPGMQSVGLIPGDRVGRFFPGYRIDDAGVAGLHEIFQGFTAHCCVDVEIEVPTTARVSPA